MTFKLYDSASLRRSIILSDGCENTVSPLREADEEDKSHLGHVKS
jgi:hypothetical protein